MNTGDSGKPPIVIDRLTAQAAQAMLKQEDTADRKVSYDQLERFATNGLGVLQEQGVYSLILYLFANSGTESEALDKADKFAVCTILLHLLNLLPQLGLNLKDLTLNQQNPAQLNTQKETILNYFANEISGEISHLLLIKNTFTQTLVYLRYGAKALKETK